MSKKPNIVLIHTDQHNGLVLGSAGDEVIRTPNLDTLSASGSRANVCYCNSPLCVPSRSSFLTGRNPLDLRIFNNLCSLPSDIPTFAHAIGNAGYETVLSGRMHFIGRDQRHGFEKRIFNDFTWTLAGTQQRNEAETLGKLQGTSFPSKIACKNSGAGWSGVLQYDEELTSATCEFLRNRKSTERPLFLTVGMYGPHAPFVAPKDLFDYYYDRVRVPHVTEETRKQMHPAIRDWFSNREVWDVSEDETRRCKAAYYGMIEYQDKKIGQLIESVYQELGRENTIIVYFSDHGDTIGEHGLFWKTNFYEGSARVPLIFSWPGHILGGYAIENLTSLVDLAPTLIDMAGGEMLPLQRGMSLYPEMIGKEAIPNRAIVSMLADIKGDRPSAMIRKNQFKLVLHNGFDIPQLFNLDTDPLENIDLGDDPLYEQEIANLKSELLTHWKPEEVDQILEISVQNNKIVNTWGLRTGVEPLEEWRPTGNIDDINYLVQWREK